MSRSKSILLPFALLFSTACGGCGPGEAGDPCDPDRADACVEGLVCAEEAAGSSDFICQIPVGGSCDPTAEEDYCYYGSACFEVEGGEETDGECLLDRGGACESEDQCAPGLTCAEVQGGEETCFEEVRIAGAVLDATDRSSIEGAHVIASDELATVFTDVAITDADGNYSIAVPAVRDSDGAPVSQFYKLRASAQDYQTFPGGLRTALPIDLGTAALDDEADAYVIQSTLTEILLIPLPENRRGLPSISGSLSPGEKGAGVLVVAEGGGGGYSALSDAAGNFTIFNVPSGAYEVRGYIAGVQFAPESVDIADEDLTGVVLEESSEGLATLTGDVSIVNAPGGSVTSVVLVVDSTFSETFVRGEIPTGLRAPRYGSPDVSGSWRIEGVPAGDYVVLAAFENDDLVRDPDTNIAGTSIVRITVAPGSDEVSVGENFKITEALAVEGPGANDAEAVTEAPTLRWQDDSSEDYYEVKVYNAYGELVWEQQVDRSQKDTVSTPYGGPLEDGMYYQFRATSWRAPGGKDPAPISTTEDLRGVFFKPAPE
ncbi:MAG: carboxypeptidase-like regulatory domain-containing protein [Myxococcota bacterium]|nr:carboxypeptidase-like regulatory domain-containing protein [Myxococcota bacterium]